MTNRHKGLSALLCIEFPGCALKSSCSVLGYHRNGPGGGGGQARSESLRLQERKVTAGGQHRVMNCRTVRKEQGTT